MARELGREGFGAFMFALSADGGARALRRLRDRRADRAGGGARPLARGALPRRRHQPQARDLHSAARRRGTGGEPRELLGRHAAGGRARGRRRRDRGHQPHVVLGLPGARAARPRIPVGDRPAHDDRARRRRAAQARCGSRDRGDRVRGRRASRARHGTAVGPPPQTRVRPRGPAALARAPALRATDRRRRPAVRAAAPARRDAAVVPFGRSRGRRSTQRRTGSSRARSSWRGRSPRRCCRGWHAHSGPSRWRAGSCAGTSSASRP